MDTPTPLYLPWPKCVSRDGHNVAVRNLREINPKYDGPAEWRASNGSYLTDEQVKDWQPLVPQGDLVEIRFTESTRVYDLYINGKLVCGSFDARMVLADAQRHVVAQGGTVTFRFTEQKEG